MGKSNNNKTVRLFRYVVPFYFSESYDKVISGLNNGSTQNSERPQNDFQNSERPQNDPRNSDPKDDFPQDGSINYIYECAPFIKGKGDSDLYEHILKSFAEKSDSSDDKNELGTAFGLYKKNRNNENIDFIRDKLVLMYNVNDKDYEINIRLQEFRLIIFRTGVGFLTYDMVLPSARITTLKLENADLKKIQYKLKDIPQNYKTQSLCISLTNAPESPPDPKTTPDLEIIPREPGIADFQNIQYKLKQTANNEVIQGLHEKYNGCLGDWIKTLLTSTVCANIGFFSGRKSARFEMKPDKALLYTYVSIPGSDVGDQSENKAHKEHKDYVRLVLGMKDSYDIKEDVPKFTPFNNIYWYATYEASGVIAYYDESNEEFLNGNFDYNVKHDYFIIYILTLYRHYSTIKLFSELSEKLSADFDDYSDPNKNKELSQKLEEFESKINVFLLKSSFSSVSYVSQHNKYYNFCKEQLRIEENIKSLSDGLTPLAKMQRIYKDQMEKEYREESEKKEQERIQAEKERLAAEENREKQRQEQHALELENQDKKMNKLGIIFTLFGMASILCDFFAFIGTVDTVDKTNEWVWQMVPIKWIGVGVAVVVIAGVLLWFFSPWSKKSGSGGQPGQNAGQAQPEPNADLSQSASGENASSEEPDQETGREEQTQ